MCIFTALDNYATSDRPHRYLFALTWAHSTSVTQRFGRFGLVLPKTRHLPFLEDSG